MSSIKIHYSLKPYLNFKEQNYALEPVMHLLNEIQKQGNLRGAAQSCGFSYRKAWNILKNSEKLFGLRLVEMQRGKGSHLSELGQKLLDIHHENKELFSENLAVATNQANSLLDAFLSQQEPLKIIASDSEILNKLRLQDPAIELHIDGSGQALAAYAQGKCEIAGFHIAPNKNNREQLDNYCQYLDKKNDQFILLEQRHQGLISHQEQPLHSLQQIVAQQLIFVNRQNGSGTRNLLDRLLKEQNIGPEQLTGYLHEEHTHLAVASVIKSRQADAGLGIQSVASRLNLHFSPITSEYYFLVFKCLTPSVLQTLQILLNQQTTQPMNYKNFLKTFSEVR
jgi:molybdate transport repressor ModE-like protein